MVLVSSTTQRRICLWLGETTIFQEVRSHLTEGMLQIVGREFQCADMRGASCKLQIDFQFKGNTSDGFAFLYSGSDSEGPPKDEKPSVKAAAFLTETWYEDSKRTALKSGHGPGKAPNRTSGAPRSSRPRPFTDLGPGPYGECAGKSCRLNRSMQHHLMC